MSLEFICISRQAAALSSMARNGEDVAMLVKIGYSACRDWLASATDGAAAWRALAGVAAPWDDSDLAGLRVAERAAIAIRDELASELSTPARKVRGGVEVAAITLGAVYRAIRARIDFLIESQRQRRLAGGQP